MIISEEKTLDELIDLIPACVDTKENEPFNWYSLQINKRTSLNIQYIVRYVCETYTFQEASNPLHERVLLKTYSENLSDALREMLGLLSEKGLINENQ